MRKTKHHYKICLVPTCRKCRADFPDLVFYGLPRPKSKRDLRHQWIKACKVDLSKISDDSKSYSICEDHFKSTDFERDLQSELLGLNRLKKFKPNAVPSLNLPPDDYQPDKPGENEEKHHPHHESDNDNDDSDDNTDTKIDKPKQPKKKILRKKPGRKRRRPPPPRPLQFGCLICCKKIPGTAKCTNYFAKYTCPGARDHDNTEEGSDVLNKQLWHIFILRNILKIDPSKCVELLHQFGTERDPDKWFHLCVKCGEGVARALYLHEQILRLEEEIKEIFNGIREAANKTVEMDKDKDVTLKKDEVEDKLWGLIREVNGILPPVMKVKDEPLDMDVGEDDSFNASNSPVSCPSPISGKEKTNSKNKMDLASRIDEILAQNEAIVGEPLCRPSGLDSDSDSDADNHRHRPKIKKASTFELFKLKRKPPPPPKPPPRKSPPKGTRNRKQFLIPRKHQDNNYTKLNCPYKCPAVFSTKEYLSQHIQAHKTSKENENKFECKFCGFVVLNEDLLKQHLEIRHHDQTQPNIIDITLVDCPCPFCEIRFHNHNILKYEAHLQLHERNSNLNKELNCPHARCGYPAEDSQSLIRHLQNRHNENLRYTCEICGYTVSKTLAGRWKSHLVKHKLNEYVTREGEESTSKFGCPICPSENFPNLKRLISHKRECHAEELGLDIFLCAECPRTFTEKTSLHYHFKANHDKDIDANVNICETCGISCTTRFALKVHQKRHNRPQVPPKQRKKYICGRCGFEFSGPGKLQRHEEKKICGDGDAPLQEKKKGLECIHCKIVLPHRTAMRRHVKIHAQHKCNICGNMFLCRDNLMKHKRSMHKSGPQTITKCQFCGKEFKHRTNLYSHLTNCEKREGNSSGKCPCPYCEREFLSKFALNGHMHSCKNRSVAEKT